MRTHHFAVWAALFSFSVGAHAQMAPSTTGRTALARFNSLDKNADGRLTERELLSRGAAADALFVMLDADGDGRLSLKEVEGAGGGARVSRFDAYDTNRDGFVSRSEFPTHLDPRLFAALDTNRDGGVSLAELRPGFAGMHPRERPRQAGSAAVHSAKSSPPPLCWVPAMGSGDGWWIEAPVVADGRRCRTSGG